MWQSDNIKSGPKKEEVPNNSYITLRVYLHSLKYDPSPKRERERERERVSEIEGRRS